MLNSDLDSALREADRCVKCGLCLPHCPTYRLYANENESPRGRIALAEALLRGQLSDSEKVADHLYRCLLCRRCEQACPSGVNYSLLLDAARAKVPRTHWSHKLVTPGSLNDLLGKAARNIPLPGTLSALNRALPKQLDAPVPGIYPATQSNGQRLGLFLGCATRSQQPNALHAAISVLNHLGFDVEVPAQQTCCGALAQHQGDQATASQQIDDNRQAFATQTTLVSIASGCSLQLDESGTHTQVVDINSLLDQYFSHQAPALRPLQARVAIHQPCTAVNGLQNGELAATLLSKIPGVEILPLGTPGNCCGAAGDHLLTQREQAITLRKPLLEQLLEFRPDYLVSSNIGCALHLAEGAASAGQTLSVLHPVELLAQQLAAANASPIDINAVN